MKKNKIINIIVFVLFILLTLLIGSRHESWSDEAQSWIISRDANVFEIVWDLSRYEGTFPLWFLILKLFISIGFKYEYIYIISTIISAIGLLIFLKNEDVPQYIKILLPFTYYIFYQYTVIARSYCLLFLAFSLLLITYKKRFEKPIKYVLNLVLFSFISMHGMIIASVFGTLFFIEILKEKKLKSYIISFLLLGIAFVLETVLLFPRSDLYMNASVIHEFKDICQVIYLYIVTNGTTLIKMYNLISLILFFTLIVYLIKIKNKEWLITFCGIVILFFLIRVAPHHLGLCFLIIVFGVISNYEILKNINKYFEKIFVLFLIMHILYTLISGANDFYKSYSGAKEMVEYIKEKRYDEKEIYGFGFESVSIQAYFENNIYANRNETIYKWSFQNKDLYEYSNFFVLDISEFKDTPEFILIEWNDSKKTLVELEKIIENTEKYELEYRTNGNQFFKNYYIETEGFSLYKLKEEK